MLALIHAFWQIAVFRHGPENLPDSRPLLLFAGLAYVLVDTIVILTLYNRDALLPLLLLDVGFLLLWSMAVLRLFGFRARLRQTLTALLGVGALLQVLAYPVTAWLSFAGLQEMPLYVGIGLSLVILLWSVAVYGHIYSRALTKSPGVGLLFAILYYIVIYEFTARLGQGS